MNYKSLFVLIVIVVLFIWGYKIDPVKFIPLFLTAVIAVSGWFVAHQLSADRDRANKHRDIQTKYLIDAYRYLANAAQRKPEPNSQYFRDMESAIADIQLFGTLSQIIEVNKFLKEFQEHGKAEMNPILNSLRNELRKELKFPEVEDNVHWFRPEGTPETKKDK